MRTANEWDQFEHKNKNFVSPSNHIIFCLIYKPINNEVFDDFPKISEWMLSKGRTNVSELFRRLPRKIRRCFDFIFLMIFPHMSLHDKLVPVQYREYKLTVRAYVSCHDLRSSSVVMTTRVMSEDLASICLQSGSYSLYLLEIVSVCWIETFPNCKLQHHNYSYTHKNNIPYF